MVADEVQRLAERSANATKTDRCTGQDDSGGYQRGGQFDGIEHVRSGWRAKLAEDAGAALQRVEQVSQDIARPPLMAPGCSSIPGSRFDQRNDERHSGDHQPDVAEGTEQTTQSIETLAQMAEQLRQTVARFKAAGRRRDGWLERRRSLVMMPCVQHDRSALRWIRGELDQSVRESRIALEDYVEGQHARLQAGIDLLHHVHGALDMVRVYGGAMLADEMEQLALAMFRKWVKRPMLPPRR